MGLGWVRALVEDRVAGCAAHELRECVKDECAIAAERLSAPGCIVVSGPEWTV